MSKPSTGFKCPACGQKHSTVIDSRSNSLCIRRRRECNGCLHRWTTYETPFPFEEVLAAITAARRLNKRLTQVGKKVEARNAGPGR